MKTLNTPFVKGLSWVLFWFLLALLGGCTPEAIPYNTHTVIIDKNNPEVYYWSNWDDSSIAHQEVPNGEGPYSFDLTGDKARLYLQTSNATVFYHRDTMDKEGIRLEIKPDNSVTAALVENGVFKIKY